MCYPQAATRGLTAGRPKTSGLRGRGVVRPHAERWALVYGLRPHSHSRLTPYWDVQGEADPNWLAQCRGSSEVQPTPSRRKQQLIRAYIKVSLYFSIFGPDSQARYPIRTDMTRARRVGWSTDQSYERPRIYGRKRSENKMR